MQNIHFWSTKMPGLTYFAPKIFSNPLLLVASSGFPKLKIGKTILNSFRSYNSTKAIIKSFPKRLLERKDPYSVYIQLIFQKIHKAWKGFFEDFNLRPTATFYPLASLSDTVTGWLVCLFVWKRQKSIVLYYHLIAYSNGSDSTNQCALRSRDKQGRHPANSCKKS